jgi:pilus assembly protein CpaB
MLRRWSTASRLFALLAVASGVAAFAIVRGYAARLEALRPVIGRPMPVVIAAADLTRGTSIGASMVRVAPLPSSLAPPGSFPDASELEGRILLTDIAEGEAITRTRLAARSAGPVAALVEPGLRAAVVDSGLPPGAVRPGDRVDVLATYGGERPHTETVASGLEVLRVMAPSPSGAVGSGSGAPSLVLLVSPLDAERLAYAKAFADLDVSISTQPAEIPSGATEAG